MNLNMMEISGGEMSLSDNHNLLNDTKIIVTDTGATCDSTAWHEGNINMKIDSA